MAQIENSAMERTGKSFAHAKKQLLRIDMTPMVDLGFLLITFFVFTTTISLPKAAELFMPAEDNNHPQPLPNSLALTLLLDDNNSIYYYGGNFEEAQKTGQIFETTYSTYNGVGKAIRQKQKDLESYPNFGGKSGLMLIIKPTSSSVYKNVIDALDEVMINDVKKYAIVEPTIEELKFIEGLRK